MLTPYAVEIRYADGPYFPTVEGMLEAEEMAKTAESFILGKFLKLGINPVRE